MSDTQCTEALAPAAGVVGTVSSTPAPCLRRWFDAFIESQARKAELCIKEHIRSVPDEVLQRAGYRRRAFRNSAPFATVSESMARLLRLFARWCAAQSAARARRIHDLAKNGLAAID